MNMMDGIESKSFELCPTYRLYVPQSRSSSDAPSLRNNGNQSPFRKAIEIDTVKDPQALEDVIELSEIVSDLFGHSGRLH